jgi:hypothetical protein|tara:strand:+ start:508 stop:852 length:345 start_codon:yes stop_codon:yes gene_type:complete
MAITYNLNILSMETQTVGENEGRVMRVGWEKIGVDENGLTGKCESSTRFPTPEDDTDSSAFIPLSELTEETVKGWVHSATSESYEERVNGFIISSINEQVNPATTRSGEDLPWL